MRAGRLKIGITLAIGLASSGVASELPGNSVDEATLQAAHLGADGPALIAYFRQRTVGEAERARILATIRRLGDEEFTVREQASGDLQAAGLPAVGLLRQAVHDPDIEIVRRAERCLRQIEKVPSTALSAAAARMLARQKPDGAIEVLLNYLPIADDDTVADEIRSALAAVAKTDRSGDALLVKTVDDPLAVRRAAAAEALARTGRPDLVESARRALRDPDPETRLRTAIALIAGARDRTTVPKLIAMLSELPQALGWRAEEVLVRLAGDDAPPVPLGSDAPARLKCRAAWEAWWDRAGAGVDFARLDGAPRMLGYTLVVQIDRGAVNAPGLPGSVFEMNAAREVIWKIEGLQYPVDAKVVGADRVLIAEYQKNMVSERDFAGRIVWNRNVLMPVSVQRLANGNTFIAARNALLELDAHQKEVYAFARPQQDIYAATRLTSGDIAFLTNTGHCVRLDKDRKEVGSFVVNFQQRPFMYFPGIEGLPNGKLLLTQLGGACEFDLAGKSGWRGAVRQPTSVQRLPNGNTLVNDLSSKTLLELDRAGEPVWEYKPTDGATPLRAYRR